jgi:hypothetical protein
MFAGQTVTFVPNVSKGVGGEEKLFRQPIILLGITYSQEILCVRSEVPMAVSMKMTVFWDVVLCSLVVVSQATQRNIPEDSHLQEILCLYRT